MPACSGRPGAISRAATAPPPRPPSGGSGRAPTSPLPAGSRRRSSRPPAQPRSISMQAGSRRPARGGFPMAARRAERPARCRRSQARAASRTGACRANVDDTGRAPRPRAGVRRLVRNWPSNVRGSGFVRREGRQTMTVPGPSDGPGLPDSGPSRGGSPQPVLTPLTAAAVFLVMTIAAGGEPEVRDLLGDLAGLQRSVGFRIPEGMLACVAGVGSQAWDRLFSGPRPVELHPFRALSGDRHRAVATPGDLLFHIRASRLDLCFELATQIMDPLGGWVTVCDDGHGV